MKKTYIIIGDKFISLGAKGILSDTFIPPMAYDGTSIKNVINLLWEQQLEIETITLYDFLANPLPQNSIYIVSQWILNRFDDTTDVLNDLRRKINKAAEQDNHFILMHHFWPEYIFKDLIDIYKYKDKKQGYFQGKLDLKVIEQHPTIDSVVEFIDKNSSSFGSDEFTYQYKSDSKFHVLIQKLPKKNDQKNFISFGYQQNNHSYIFLIDIHGIGKYDVHSHYFNILFRNTLNYLLSKE